MRPNQQYLDAQGSGFRLSQVFGNVDAHAADCVQLVKVNRHHTWRAIITQWKANSPPANQSADILQDSSETWPEMVRIKRTLGCLWGWRLPLCLPINSGIAMGMDISHATNSLPANQHPHQGANCRKGYVSRHSMLTLVVLYESLHSYINHLITHPSTMAIS